ncbi:MAG TPA: DUF4388 domain-containing protein [Chloroflexota bacterium]|nr:DUF4388 domain-containing protein [Chloroflexota bacterium]
MSALPDVLAGIDLDVVVRVVVGLRLSGRLCVQRDGWTGSVSFDHGQIIAAEFETEQGWSALEAILVTLADGQCTFSHQAIATDGSLPEPPESLEAQLDRAARRRARLASAGPSLSAVPQLHPLEGARQSGGEVTLPCSALTTLMAIDGQRTVGQLGLAGGLVRTLENLATLVDLGLVVIAEPARSAVPSDSASPSGYGPGPGPQPAGTGDPTLSAGRAPQARGPLAAWARPLYHGAAWLRTQIHATAPQVRWLASVVVATAIVIGLAGAFQAVVGQTAESSASPGPDVTFGGASGESPPPAVATPGAPPRVLLDEQFASSPANWLNNPQSTAWLADGAYHLLARVPGQFVAVAAPVTPTAGDIAVSASLRKVGGPPGGGYGIILRDQGPGPRDGVNQQGTFYVLLVNDRGEIGISRRAGDHWEDLLPWQPSSAVHPGNAANQLLALATGEYLGFAVNGVAVAMQHDAALSGGAVGLYVGGDGTEVTVERFRVEEPLSNLGGDR